MLRPVYRHCPTQRRFTCLCHVMNQDCDKQRRLSLHLPCSGRCTDTARSAALLYTCHAQAQPASEKTCVSVKWFILRSCVLYATATCRLFGLWSGACTFHVDFVRLDVVRVRVLCRLLLRCLLWNRFASCRMLPDIVSASLRTNILLLCALLPSVNFPCCCVVAACSV